MKVYYLYSDDTEREFGPPGKEDWDSFNLFIPMNLQEPKVGNEVILVSYLADFVSKTRMGEVWKEWPNELPRRFYQRAIEGLFTEEE